MRVDQFDFDLPAERIALRPMEPRDQSRMLVVNGEQVPVDAHIGDLADFLQPGDALVFNNTRVIKAQLEGERLRESGVPAKASLTLHLRKDANTWAAFAKKTKKIRIGDRLRFEEQPNASSNTCMSGLLEGTVTSKGEAGEIEIAFDLSGPALDEAIALVGQIPLPPYIASRRHEDGQDSHDYQTIYAAADGAVAAPTAGLHFSDEMFARFDAKGIERHFVTLHVGAGTFLPVKVDDTQNHKMHSEWGEVSAEIATKLNAVRARGNRVFAVGTTSLRLLESAARETGKIGAWSGLTDIFITPGYNFCAVDALVTNFHLPRSTLFMLVSAFAGLKKMRSAYEHAIANQYRFYSYGDASLLFPESSK